MKKLLCVIMIIPLVAASQEVFSSSFNYGSQSYTTTTPTSVFLKQNNQNLRNDACEYDKNLQESMEKLQRSPQNNTRINTPSQNAVRQDESPGWWRWENSYEGWGFD